MEAFHWNSDFLTGLKSVDEQHHHLVDLINDYGALLASDSLDASALQKVLGELAEYAANHFRDEEALMGSVGVDERHVRRHRTEHARFIDDVTERAQALELSSDGETASLLRFLTSWLVLHILGTDQNMAHQIGSIRSGMPADQAFEDNERARSRSSTPLLGALHELFQLVSDRNRELNELNRTLESKVEERTRDLEVANSRLETLALTDVLTDLPNRRHAMSWLAELWAAASMDGSPVTCMMVDADHFKEVNDDFGHDAGDAVLRELSRTLRHAVRTDDLVCRLGGDEFLIICPDTPREGSMILAAQVHEKVNALTVDAGSGKWHGSISIGVATSGPDTPSYEDLIKQADRGVYLAKEAGKNCVRAVDE